MLLSIVMMIKNEEKILKKTLSSMNDLRQNLDTELIIVDTGSKDNSVNIAKEFTEKVYIEKWNDNFSDMRNKSISYAKGDWILIIDADEVLTNCDKLIKFFKDKLYKEYKSASIALKNLYSNDKTSYGNTSILRMFENKEFSYSGLIHEQPNYKHPIYNDIAEFEHYGYLFEDEEFKLKKLRRNEILLLKELEINKKNEYANYQLGKNLITEGKYSEGIKYLEYSLKLHEDKKMYPEYLYNNIAKTYLNLQKHQKCENICKKYINKDNKNIDIYFYLGVSRYTLCKYESSIKAFERYIYLVNNYEITTQCSSLCCESDTMSLYEDVMIMIINSLYKLEKYDDVKNYFDKIHTQQNKNKVYKILFESLNKSKQIDKILDYFEDIKVSQINKNEFYKSLELFIDNVSEEDRNNIYQLCLNLDGNYKVLNECRVSKELDVDKIKEILKSENEIYYTDLIKIAIDNNIDLLELLNNLNSLDIERYITSLIIKNKSFGIYLYDYLMNLEYKFDMNNIRIVHILYKALVNNHTLSDERYINIFYIYNMYSYMNIKSLYKEFDDEELLIYLNDSTDLFNIEFRNIIQTKNVDKNTINDLRKMIYKYPGYKTILNHRINEIKEVLIKGQEFMLLKDSLINNINQMISNNDISKAKEVIDQYLIEFKEDSKILNTLGVLYYIQSDSKKANITLKKALSYDCFDEDIIYNIKNIV